MERFMTKGDAVMSKDFFAMKRNAARPSAAGAPPTTAPTDQPGAPAPAGGEQQREGGFKGGHSRGKGGLLVQAQMMSKDHFRRPLARETSPTLRRAETWAAGMSSQEVATRASDVAGAGEESSGEGGMDAQGVWTSCPGLQVLQKRREEEEMLERKVQEAITLWREIDSEGLDSLVLEVPSEDEGPEGAPDDALSMSDQTNAKPVSGEDNGNARSDTPRSERVPSVTGDEEQDVTDPTENGISEREEDEERPSLRKSRRATTDITSHSSKIADQESSDTSPCQQHPVERPNAVEKFRRDQEKREKKKKRASVLGVLQVDKLNNETEDPDSGDETTETDMDSTTATKERPVKKTAYGRLYSSIRRRTSHVSHGPTDSENDDSEKGAKADRRAEKKREKEEKAQRKRKQKEERDQRKAGKKGQADAASTAGYEASAETTATDINAVSQSSTEAAPVLERRGTIPRNFKMHFMDVFKGGDAESEGRGRKDKRKTKNKKKRRKERGMSSSVLSYSEPEADIAERDQLGQEGGAQGQDLKKKLKKARKKNKQQEEQIKKQQLEIERMRKELERVRRQRKERKRRTNGSEVDTDSKDSNDGEAMGGSAIIIRTKGNTSNT